MSEFNEHEYGIHGGHGVPPSEEGISGGDPDAALRGLFPATIGDLRDMEELRALRVLFHTFGIGEPLFRGEAL